MIYRRAHSRRQVNDTMLICRAMPITLMPLMAPPAQAILNIQRCAADAGR